MYIYIYTYRIWDHFFKSGSSITPSTLSCSRGIIIFLLNEWPFNNNGSIEHIPLSNLYFFSFCNGNKENLIEEKKDPPSTKCTSGQRKNKLNKGTEVEKVLKINLKCAEKSTWAQPTNAQSPKTRQFRSCHIIHIMHKGTAPQTTAWQDLRNAPIQQANRSTTRASITQDKPNK